MKLYEVHVEFTYYCLAESRSEAQSLCRDAFGDEEYDAIADATECTNRTVPDWDGQSLVYGTDEDTTLDQALASQGLPSVAALKEMWSLRMIPRDRGCPP